jgi:hypothetical protein
MPWTWDDTWQRAAADMAGQPYRRNLHTVIHDTDPPPPRDPGDELTTSTLFGRPLARAMADVVSAALTDPTAEHLPIRDRLLIGTFTYRR